jgi:hypothetical protein
VRLALLLHHLNEHEFKRLPPGVGRKTVNHASEAGLIDVRYDLQFPMCRLTAAGLAERHAKPYIRLSKDRVLSEKCAERQAVSERWSIDPDFANRLG